MQEQSKQYLLGRLPNGLSGLRGGAGHFSAPLQEFADGSLVPTDAQGESDERANPNGGESPIA